MNLSPFTGAYLANPAEVWARLKGGVTLAEDLGLWLIPGHADVKRALGDPDTFSNAQTLMPVYEPCDEAMAIIMKIDAPPTTAAADAPTHTRTRRALRATFANTPARVEAQYGPIVRRRVDELVSKLADRHGEVDLVPELTTVLPLLVVADILGVPEHDVPALKRWADGQIALVWGDPDPDEQVRLAKGLLEFWRYCQDLVGKSLASGHTGDDFVSAALRFRNGDDARLTEDEVASIAFNLLVAGHETTAGLLAHAVDRALTVPARWCGMAQDPARVPAFVEETLRFGPPIDAWLRVTTRAVTVGGMPIPAGARCLLMLGAANRDEAVFNDPDRFDQTRADVAGHLSFGYGPHFCIGAGLARLEARVAFERLTLAVPDMRLAHGHCSEFHPNVAFRALRALPVVL